MKGTINYYSFSRREVEYFLPKNSLTIINIVSS